MEEWRKYFCYIAWTAWMPVVRCWGYIYISLYTYMALMGGNMCGLYELQCSPRSKIIWIML